MILRAANALEDVRGPGGGGEISVDLDLCGAVDTFFFNPAEPAGRCALEQCRVSNVYFCCTRVEVVELTSMISILTCSSMFT